MHAHLLKDITTQRVALLGLPFDHHSSFLKGAAQAPPRIREALASTSSNPWSETGVDTSEASLVLDLGDLESSPEKSHEAIEAGVDGIAEAKLVPILLGGDHSVTWPVVRAMARHHPGLSILQVDAHPDLYDSYDDDPASHASPFARILEEGLACRLVQVGIRTLNPHLREQAHRFGVEMIEMRHRDHLGKVTIEGPVYVSIDLDGLDPACAPGVAHPEPGGLTTREVIDLLHGLQGTLVGADVVELNPPRDHGDMTARLAAKLVKELIGVVAS